MKKILLTTLGFLMLCIGIHAQTNIANYTFASSSGSYVPLTGATTFTNSWDDEVTAAIPLGGSFTFGATTYTACFISANGFITFGAAPAGSNYTPLSTLGTTSGAIAAFARDGGNSTAVGAAPSISYMNIGGAAGEFVVEYKDHASWAGRATEKLNTQIRLNLATGSISFVYGSWNAPGAASTAQVGIRGNSTTWSTNVNSLNTVDVPTGTTCNWSNAITTVANNSSMLFSNANSLVVPSNGLTFTWIPPVNATLAPVRVFSAVAGITSSGATIAWTAPTSATQYNVQYRQNNSCAWTNFSGNPVSAASATLTGLNPATVYQVRVQSSDATNNAIWSHIPNQAGTGGGYSSAAGTFSTTGLSSDLQTLALNAPAVSASGCYGSAIPLIIQLKNAGTTTIDFSTNNATVLTSITGTNPQSFTTTVNTGTLAANATLNVTVTATYNMSAVGVYTINASSTLATPDANLVNNSMPTVTRTSTSGTPAPYFQDFAAGATPAGWVNTSTWLFGATHGVTNNGIFKNLYSTVTSASFNLLKLGTLVGNESITFDFRVLNYSATYPGTQIPPTGNWGNLQVQVSTDCGATFATIGTIDNTTHTVTTQAFTNKGYSLAAYAGQNVIIKILGTWVSGDYFIDLDNFNIASCFAPTNVAASNISQTGATVTWLNPLFGTPASYNYEIRTSGAAASGTAGLVASGNVIAPTTSVSISGLAALTSYSIYVQSNCGGSDVSTWTSVSTFTTLANCPVPSSVSIASTPTTAVASWIAGGSETAWDVYYGVNPLAAPSATSVPTGTTATTSFTLNSLSPTTSYGFYVRSNCGAGTTSLWTAVSSFTTPCLPPNLLATNGSIRCGTGTSTLSATGDAGATIQWYANSTGGAPLASGNTFTTPSISATTNYYVAAVGNLTTENVGRASAASASGFITTPNWGIVLNTTKNVLINSVTIYPIGTGSVTIALLDATGTELASTAALAVTGTGTNSPVVVNLGFNVPTGNNYKVVLKAYTGITNLIRDNSGNVFPYNSTSGAISVTGGWTGTGVSASYYWFYNLNVSSGCESARTMVTATVTAPPALTLSSPSAICAGSGIATLSVTSTLSDYDSYSWTPTTGLFTDAAATVPYTGTATTVYVNTTTDGVLNYNVAANNSVSGCAIIASASVAINAAPTSITLTANPNPVCAGSTLSLSATPNAIPVTVFTENFNGATNTWSTTNTSTGGTTANAAWTLRNSPYTSNVGTGISSNDASQFYLADSDAQGSGGTTNVTLQSPAINTNGLTTLSLNFYHYYNYYASDAALVEVSTNGTTWTIVKNYSTGSVDIGSPNAFNAESINLNAYIGNTTLYVRYNFSAVFGYGWAIDNVTLTGTTINDYSYAWTSTPAGFTASTSTTTANPTANTTYSVVITNTATSCANSGSVAVTVNALPTVIASSSSASICASSTVSLTATGATNYTWTSGGNTSTEIVSPTTNTTYTVTGEALGCSNVATVSIGVTALPNVMAMSSNTAICAGSSATLSAMGASNYTWTGGGNTSTEVVTPTSNSTYTVTGEDLGCSNVATVSIGVTALPNVMAMSSNAAICAGSSATLSAMGASNYTWTGGGNSTTEVVSPTANSTYTLTGEDLGCSSTATVSVNVNPIPVVSAIASQTLLCDDGSTGSSVLTASTTATSYLWSDGATTITTAVTPTLTTTYTVTVTELGCSADAFVTVNVSNCNGVKELVANGIAIYPNPTNGILNISISTELAGNTSIEVYDALGKLVIKDLLSTEITTLNTLKLTDGMYVYKVINNNKAIKIGKIVKH